MSDRERKQYKYSKLGDVSTAIRLVEVLPGGFTDQIRLRIFEASLAEYGESETLLSLRGIQKTLPKGWRVKESINGDYLFSRDGKEWQRTHPDDSVETWKYMLLKDEHVGLESDGETSTCVRRRYDALSYTWGTETGAEIALVQRDEHCSEQGNPVHTESAMTIWKNLAEALRHLRDEKRIRTLWVDAICINQSDSTEKMIQVRHMDSIYRQARRVVAFIGPPDNSSQLAISTLEYLGAQVTWTGFGWRSKSVEAVEPDWHMRGTDLGYDEATWDAILTLLSRPWFSRLWIVQEVRLAGPRSIIQCGQDSLSLPLFRRAIWCLKSKSWLPSSSLRQGVGSADRLLKGVVTPSLSSLLDISRQQGCSDPRDKICGIISLLSDRLAAKIHTSYSLPPLELYKNVFLAHLRCTRRLELFHFCSQATRSISGPSWVPDLSTDIPVRRACRSQFASGCSRAHFCYREPNILAVLGVSAAIISKISEPLMPGSEDAVDRIRSWQPSNLLTGDYSASMSMLRAHSTVLRMNRLHERQPGIIITEKEWLAVNADVGLWGDTSLPIPPEAKTNFAKAIANCEGRMYVHTREGHIGLAPLDTRPGKNLIIKSCLLKSTDC